MMLLQSKSKLSRKEQGLTNSIENEENSSKQEDQSMLFTKIADTPIKLICIRKTLRSYKNTYSTSSLAFKAGLQIRHFEKKLKGKKTHNSRKKLNNSAEKLKDLTKFTERRKKLKYFCCKNTFYQKSIAFSYKKLCCLQ